MAEAVGINRNTLAAHVREANMRKTSRGWDSQALLDYLKNKEADELPTQDAKEMKVRLECDILRERLKTIREETIPYEEHLREITGHAHLMIQGLDEFESIAAAEFPESPRMLECAQKVSDRVRGIMFEKAKKIETSEV